LWFSGLACAIAAQQILLGTPVPFHYHLLYSGVQKERLVPYWNDALGDSIASRIIKPLVARIRPCNDFHLADIIIHRVPCGSGYSFPSSHATNHFGIAVFFIVVFYKSWKPILPIGLVWAFLISMSQVYVGVHYPLDTLAGAILGTGIALFTGTLYKRLQAHI
jgi:membrane-associated phospholipid phosphatase